MVVSKKKRVVKKVPAISVVEVNRRLTRLQKSVDALVQHQRLATIFELRGNGAELKVSSEQFEPNREHIASQIESVVRSEDHPNPETWGFCVINRLGLDAFVTGKVRLEIQNGLARLRANGDIGGATNFAREVVAQL